MNQSFYNTSQIINEIRLSHHEKKKLMKLSLKLAFKGSKGAAVSGHGKYEDYKKKKADKIYTDLKNDLEN